MSTPTHALTLAIFSASTLFAQLGGYTPPGTIQFVVTDPSGSCSNNTSLQFNTANSHLSGCNGTWKVIGLAAPGSGGDLIYNNSGTLGATALATDGVGLVLNDGYITGTTTNPTWKLLSSTSTGLRNLVFQGQGVSGNSITMLYVLPQGTSSASEIELNNGSDLTFTNSTYFLVGTIGDHVRLETSMRGTGSGLPITSLDIGEGTSGAGALTAINFQSSGNTTAGVLPAAGLYFETLYTPSSSSAACAAGTFADDANYHYVCVAANTWKRAALSSF